MRRVGWVIVCASLVVVAERTACGLPPAGALYSEDFDVDASASWIVNPTAGPPTPGLPGSTDVHADFFFDYALVGIPPAPQTSAGTTLGMKLQTNLTSGIFGGFSTSPIGQSFSGDYALSFDMWANYHGPLDMLQSGTTNLSLAGVLTSGTAPNAAGAADGVFFAMTGDGGSAADYRAYAPDRPISYQIPQTAPVDDAATHFAGSRNNTAAYYQASINPPEALVTAPPMQMTLYPQQTGFVQPGAAGMTWRTHVITKIGTVVTWLIDGTPIIEVDTSKFVTPTGGGNILFGVSDINAGSPQDPLAADLLFTLVDNVVVQQIPEPAPWVVAAAGLAALVAASRSCTHAK